MKNFPLLGIIFAIVAFLFIIDAIFWGLFQVAVIVLFLVENWWLPLLLLAYIIWLFISDFKTKKTKNVEVTYTETKDEKRKRLKSYENVFILKINSGKGKVTVGSSLLFPPKKIGWIRINKFFTNEQENLKKVFKRGINLNKYLTFGDKVDVDDDESRLYYVEFKDQWDHNSMYLDLKK